MSNVICPAVKPGILHWVGFYRPGGRDVKALSNPERSSFFRVKPSTMTIKRVQSAGSAK